ncbi:MAG: transposase [Candidatus Dadabacteria bacterium]|nr:transposase [Candidatus Dadabacteria bacterium]
MEHQTSPRSVTYRLLLETKGKAGKLFQIAGACRFVWNAALERNRAEYQTAKIFGTPKPSVSFFSLGKQFTELRRKTPWLMELPAREIRYTLKYQADAWQKTFKQGAGFPKRKTRARSTPSFTIPEQVNLKDNRLFIPKTGRVTLRGNNPYEGCEPKLATIKYLAGKWYCSVLYDVPADRVKQPAQTDAVGIDRNVSGIALSTEELKHLPGRDTKRLEIRRRRYQRRMARQVKGSRRRNITKARVARISRTLGNVRKNWAHQTTRRIADKYETVVIEDLNIPGMTASAKGTETEPGKNVRQKAGLNREILASAWGNFENKLAYKCGTLIKVEPAYTSQTCSRCGNIDKESRKDRDFHCVKCGHKDHADINAAKNILALGIGATARGGALSSDTPLIRENETG